MINYKKYAIEAIRYKKEIAILLNSFEEKDIEQGLLVIKDSMISTDFKEFLLSRSNGLLRDYQVRFTNGFIQIQASIHAKQLGLVEVDYMINVQELRFDQSGHKLYASFTESVDPLGNMAQKLAVKAALLNGPLLKTALQFSHADYLYIDGNNIFVDFDKLDFIDLLPPTLSLKYLSAKNSALTLAFNL